MRLNHHLSLRGRQWWLGVMTHPTSITKARVQRALGTGSIVVARRLRDAFLVANAAILPRRPNARDHHLRRYPSGLYAIVLHLGSLSVERSLRTHDPATARRKRDAILSGRAPIPVNQPNQPRLHRVVRLPLAA